MWSRYWIYHLILTAIRTPGDSEHSDRWTAMRRRSLIHHPFWGFHTVQFPWCSSTLSCFIIILFQFPSVGSFNVFERKEAHIFMSQVLNVLNYLQCPAWVSTQGPCTQLSQLHPCCPRLSKAQGAEFQDDPAPSSPAAFELRAAHYLLEQDCPGPILPEPTWWAKGSCFPSLKCPFLNKFFRQF